MENESLGGTGNTGVPPRAGCRVASDVRVPGGGCVPGRVTPAPAHPLGHPAVWAAAGTPGAPPWRGAIVLPGLGQPRERGEGPESRQRSAGAQKGRRVPWGGQEQRNEGDICFV